jgi:hypothetical protein
MGALPVSHPICVHLHNLRPKNLNFYRTNSFKKRTPHTSALAIPRPDTTLERGEGPCRRFTRYQSSAPIPPPRYLLSSIFYPLPASPPIPPPRHPPSSTLYPLPPPPARPLLKHQPTSMLQMLQDVTQTRSLPRPHLKHQPASMLQMLQDVTQARSIPHPRRQHSVLSPQHSALNLFPPTPTNYKTNPIPSQTRAPKSAATLFPA